MGLLGKAEILAAQDLKVSADVAVPEWGGTIRVRVLSGTERDNFDYDVWERDREGNPTRTRNYRAKLVALCVVDEQGQRVFSDLDAIELGRGKSAPALNRVFEAAQRLNGMGRLGAEDAEKNSDGQNSGSGCS